MVVPRAGRGSGGSNAGAHGKMRREFRLATAQIQGAELLTCDAHFEGLPQVIFLKKC